MKSFLLKLFTKIFFVCVFATGCEKETVRICPFEDGLVIYKTRNDYFDHVHIKLFHGTVGGAPSIKDDVYFDKKGGIHYALRAKLDSGYVLALAHSIHSAFLSYSFQEYYEIETTGILPDTKKLKEHIIDNDPFVEYYYDPSPYQLYGFADSMAINLLIRKGALTSYFEKLK